MCPRTPGRWDVSARLGQSAGSACCGCSCQDRTMRAKKARQENNARSVLMTLLAVALIDIRATAYADAHIVEVEGLTGTERIRFVADLFHTIPGLINRGQMTMVTTRRFSTNYGPGMFSSDNRGSMASSNTERSIVHPRPSMRGNSDLTGSPDSPASVGQ